MSTAPESDLQRSINLAVVVVLCFGTGIAMGLGYPDLVAELETLPRVGLALKGSIPLICH